MALWNYGENWKSQWSVLFNSSDGLEAIIKYVNGKYKGKGWEKN